jgi:hypothetical protein
MPSTVTPYLTVIPSSGEISFSNIQSVFGGENPINLSEYYSNASTNYTVGVSGIPNIGSQISLSQFRGKSKIVNYMISGNAVGSMVEPAGTITITSLTQVDGGLGFLGDIGFSFYFFGTDYRTNINWSSNHVLQFGNLGGGNINIWNSNDGKAILLGNFDRKCNIAKACPTTNSNGYYIKRLLIDSDSSWSADTNDIKMELRLIRGSTEQYIEVRFAQWTAANAGTWNITDGSAFKGTFGAYVPVNGTSFVLKSNLNGDNWQFFNNYNINL